MASWHVSRRILGSWRCTLALTTVVTPVNHDRLCLLNGVDHPWPTVIVLTWQTSRLNLRFLVWEFSTEVLK